AVAGGQDQLLAHHRDRLEVAVCGGPAEAEALDDAARGRIELVDDGPLVVVREHPPALSTARPLMSRSEPGSSHRSAGGARKSNLASSAGVRTGPAPSETASVLRASAPADITPR